MAIGVAIGGYPTDNNLVGRAALRQLCSAHPAMPLLLLGLTLGANMNGRYIVGSVDKVGVPFNDDYGVHTPTHALSTLHPTTSSPHCTYT